MPSQPSLQEYDFAVTLVVLVQHNARMRAAHCELGLALLNHFGGARAALEALPGLARRGGGASGPQICLREQAREIEACGKLGCEGIVSKRLGSLYKSGRSPHWVKVKNPKAPAVKREAEEDWGSPHWIRSKNRSRQP